MGEKLRPKYVVTRVDDGGKRLSADMRATDPDNVDAPFVLLPRKDPAAFYALMSYAQVCENDLAREIRNWLREINKAPAEYGTQGARNRVAMRAKQMDLFE